MRVLHVVKKYPPLIGGDATAVAALARAQRLVGEDVEILTNRAAPASGTDDEARVHRVGPAQTSAQLDRVSLRRARGAAAMRTWAKAQVKGRLDIVHAHAVDVGFAVAPAAQAAGVPTVLTCHGVWFPLHGQRSARGRMEIGLLRRGGYGVITAVDGGSVAALRSIGYEARLVPNGVDLAEVAGPQSRDGPFRFLFAGRHESQKGLDVLVEAAAELRGETRDFALDLVGVGTLTAGLRSRAHERGLDGVVRFPGPLPRADLVRAFRNADAFVLPSRHEGFPITILEAWAAHLPVIATKVGGIPEVCTPENAVLLPPDDSSALAAAMASLMDDRDRRRRLADAGHALARDRFSWDAVAERYRELYASLG